MVYLTCQKGAKNKSSLLGFTYPLRLPIYILPLPSDANPEKEESPNIYFKGKQSNVF